MTLFPMLSPGLRAVASTQRGVFTAGQAYATGHTQKELQRLRQAKLIMSLRRGVYVDMVAWAKPIRWSGCDSGRPAWLWR
jgi:hypothetical protein